LLSFSLFGLLLVAVCSDFLCFYLAIELQSLCFYALSTFHKSSEYSAEAGVKYFILGAFSSGLLLLGFNLFYAFFGDLSYAQIEKVGSFAIPLTVVGGYLFFSASLLFKLGSFPFHMWLCDVYDGAMVNITAFFSIIPKVIILAFLIRALSVVFVEKPDAIKIMFVVCGLCSVCFASIAALYQKRVKRLLAYSTISHTGFMILGICCYSADGVKACTVYITLYVIMLLATFGVVFLSGTYKAPQKYLVN
jgi:NADH-quinone oxidoreductase subunit N